MDSVIGSFNMQEAIRIEKEKIRRKYCSGQAFL